MTENKQEQITSRAKMNQGVYKEIYKDDETEFSRETYRKESKINALFKDDSLEDTFVLEFADIEESKNRSKVSIESFLDFETNKDDYEEFLRESERAGSFAKPKKVEYVNEYIEPIEQEDVVEELIQETEVVEELIQPDPQSAPKEVSSELAQLRTNLELKDSENVLEDLFDDEVVEYDSKIDTAMLNDLYSPEPTSNDIYQTSETSEPEVDTAVINELLDPTPISKEELAGDLEIETEELEDFIITSLIENINGKDQTAKVTKNTDFDLPNDLFELTSTLSVEGLNEIEESIKRNNRLIKYLIVVFVVIVFVLSYIVITSLM